MQNLVTIGILSYNDKKYLDRALASILNQTYSNFEVLVCDNNPKSYELEKWIKSKFPSVKVLNAGGNVGFAVGHNFLINQAKGDFYLCQNSDIYLDPNYLQNLVELIQKDPKTATVTGKLFRYQADQLDLIDTTGIIPHASHYFSERGQLEPKSNFNKVTEIWGCSGASFLLNLKLLRKHKHFKEEFFDSTFFMYKEYVDLAYRVPWLGFKSFYTPEAHGWHDRTIAKPKNFLAGLLERRRRPAYVRQYSLLNQLRLTFKNWSFQYSLKTYLSSIIHLLKINLYTLLQTSLPVISSCSNNP
jgi:GT2 family glycosyltransferase